MFKFDFKVEEDGDNPFSKDVESVDPKENDSDQSMEWYESKEILPKGDAIDNLDIYQLNSICTMAGDISLTYTISGLLLQDISSNEDTSIDIKRAEKNHSDLIPGVYEGGAKIWECTEDLLKYMSTHYKSDTWLGKRVLDLGCGAGLLGIYAYKSGAKVEFQDYNGDVLEKITIPNVLLNVPKPPNVSDLDLKKLSEDVKFYAGDWSKYAALTKDDEKFDVILTSETIYNPENHQKLIDTFAAKLKPNGFVLVAAKVYYFGVGGGLREFEDLIAKDQNFQAKVLWTATESLNREILELRRSR